MQRFLPNPAKSDRLLACSKCHKPMRLSCIEPSAPGFDIRTFECLACNTTEKFSVAI